MLNASKLRNSSMQSEIAHKRFGEMVYKARKAKGLKNKEISDYAGCDQSLMTLVQRDGHVPGHEICIKMAEILGIDQDTFLAMAGYANERIRSVFLMASGVLA